MRIVTPSHNPENVLWEAVERVREHFGVPIAPIHPRYLSRHSISVKISLSAMSGSPTDNVFRRLSINTWDAKPQRRLAALCGHGFGVLIETIFRLAPDARVYTAFASYKSYQSFRDTWETIMERNIGSMMMPTYLSDACMCNELRDFEIYMSDGDTSLSGTIARSALLNII